MQALDIHSPAFLALFTPALLTVVYLLHAGWVLLHRKTDSQQQIALLDLNNLTNPADAKLAGLTYVEGSHVSYAAPNRTVHDIELPDDAELLDVEKNVWRVRHALTVKDDRVNSPLICDDELTVEGASVFNGAVKVNGDLNIEKGADVTFHEPVIVNGVFRLRGKAHFAQGILAKGDTLIEGTLAIGTKSRRGWAVMRQLGLQNEIHINGRIVAERAIAVKEDA